MSFHPKLHLLVARAMSARSSEPRGIDAASPLWRLEKSIFTSCSPTLWKHVCSFDMLPNKAVLGTLIADPSSRHIIPLQLESHRLKLYQPINIYEIWYRTLID